jgi:dTDP-4-dehydrorhamnose reductase
MNKVAVLGSSGLLGYGLTKFLSDQGFQVTEFNRQGISVLPGGQAERIDVISFNSDSFLHNLGEAKWIINCIGMIKHRIQSEDENSLAQTRIVNSNFPKILGELAAQNDLRVIQIGTDCVYTGISGNYDESSFKDATDIYGVSKIEGEANLQSTLLLRSSFIGRELETKIEFLEWVLSHERFSQVSGFSNHLWNGLTVLQIGRVIAGIVISDNPLSGVQHLIPQDSVSKFELAALISSKFGREDLVINRVTAPMAIDRRLDTLNRSENDRLWRDAGYSTIPTITLMIDEYREWVGVNSDE